MREMDARGGRREGGGAGAGVFSEAPLEMMVVVVVSLREEVLFCTSTISEGGL